MDTALSIITSPHILPWFILCAVVVFERFWPLPIRLDPLAFVRLIAQRMADRVCPKASPLSKSQANNLENNLAHTIPKTQYWISGSLAAFMIVVPNIIILMIFREFVYYPELFDACLLYLCIQFSAHIQRFQHIRRALGAGKKTLSKELLAPMVLRDTAVMSDIGVSKAAIESIFLRFHYQALVCFFLFIVIGPFTALSYRLCYELHLVWNTKLPAFSEFGKPMAKLCMLIQWLPIRLNAFLSIFLSRGFGVFTYIRNTKLSKKWNEAHGAILLRAHHFALDVNLSGAVYYQGRKIRREKYIGRGEPNANFMPNALAVLNRVLIINLLLLLLTCLIINALYMIL